MTPFEVAEQRQKLKKLAVKEPAGAPAKPAGKKRGRPKGTGKAKASPAARVTSPAASPRGAGPVDLIDLLFDFAEECGGLGQLKRLVDRIAQVEKA